MFTNKLFKKKFNQKIIRANAQSLPKKISFLKKIIRTNVKKNN